MAHVYALVDPRSGWIRYVGKTVGTLSSRMSEHMYSRKREDTPVYRWIRKLSYEKLRPSIVELQRVTESRVNKAEIFWIAQARSLFPEMLNVGDGGEGPIYGESHWKAHLTSGNVIEIRNRYRRVNVTVSQLADEYGINSNSMYKVIVGQTWGHIPGALSQKAAKDVSKKLKVLGKGCSIITDEQLSLMIDFRKNKKWSYQKIADAIGISLYRARLAIKDI